MGAALSLIPPWDMSANIRRCSGNGENGCGNLELHVSCQGHPNRDAHPHGAVLGGKARICFADAIELLHRAAVGIWGLGSTILCKGPAVRGEDSVPAHSKVLS